VPLVACTGDQAAVPFARGALDAGVAYLNIGTGAFVLRAISRPLLAPPLLTSVLRADATAVEHVLEGTVNGAMAALDAFAAGEGAVVEDLLSAVDDDAAIGEYAPFFLNGVGGLGAPFWVPDFASRFEGTGTVRERFRAVIESIAFLARANLDEMGRHLRPPACLVATGGLSRNRLLRRLLARLTGAPVAFAAEPEATARGLAYLTAHGPQHWDPGHVEIMSPVIDQVEQARYVKWLELMRSAIEGR
jgi:glycerol kinase